MSLHWLANHIIDLIAPKTNKKGGTSTLTSTLTLAELQVLPMCLDVISWAED